MEIAIAADGTAQLTDVDNFRAFSVAVADDVPPAVLLDALVSFGIPSPDATYVFVDQEWLLANTNGRKDDAAWRSGYDAMVVYAAISGWTDDAGRIRAHIAVT